MEKAFGMANDFYRTRVIKYDEKTPPEFEWRDDILYRQPPGFKEETDIKYLLQILTIDNKDKYILLTFKTQNKAFLKKKQVDEDIEELTKLEFERKYKFLTQENKQNFAQKEQ